VPLDVLRVPHQEIVRLHRALAPRDRRLLHERLFGDDVRELIDELSDVQRGLGEELVFLVTLGGPCGRYRRMTARIPTTRRRADIGGSYILRRV
jgi:hypothetical protein